jgi:hypothetical protein
MENKTSFLNCIKNLEYKQQQLLGYAICALVLGLFAVIYYNLSQPPSYESLQVIEDQISAKPYIVVSGSRGNHTSMYVPLRLIRTYVSENRICRIFDWDVCGTNMPPPDIDALVPGDKVKAWLKGAELWQLSYDGKILFGYQKSVEAFNKAKSLMIEIGYGALGLGFLLICLVLLQVWQSSKNSESTD